jgi:hypothetical protein
MQSNWNGYDTYESHEMLHKSKKKNWICKLWIINDNELYNIKDGRPHAIVNWPKSMQLSNA